MKVSPSGGDICCCELRSIDRSDIFCNLICRGDLWSPIDLLLFATAWGEHCSPFFVYRKKIIK